MKSFIFGADGLPKTPAELARLRAMADALTPSQSPQNVGEGIASIGNAILYRALINKADSGQKAGTDAASSRFDNVFKALSGGGAPSPVTATPSATPTSTDAAVPPLPPGSEAYRNSIASIESAGSGDYSAIGPTDAKMGRPLGRYQIMEANIGPWSKEALGREVTPDEFLKNPQLQDAIFDKKFGGYVQQYGPEGAAQAWFGGPGSVGKGDRKDVLGTSVSEYGKRFVAGIGGQQPDAIAAQPGMAATASPAMGYADPQVVTPNAPQQAAPALPAPVEIASLPVAGMNEVPTGSDQAGGLDPGKDLGMLRALAGLSGRDPSATGAFPAAPGMEVAQAAPASGFDLSGAIEVMNDPFLPEGKRAVLQALIGQQLDQQKTLREQQMKQADPMYQLNLRKSRAELDQLEHPTIGPADQAKIDIEKEKMQREQANRGSLSAAEKAQADRDNQRLALDRQKFEAEVNKGQWEKLNDGRLYNKTSGEIKDAPPPVPGSTPLKFDDVSSLRKEIQQLPSYKNLAQAGPIYRSMLETADRNSKASDLNLVYGLGKIMDPNSVVREGEMVMVKDTGSLPDWLQGAIASLNGGAALTPETRQAIMREAFGRVKGYNDAFGNDSQQYQGIVERNRLNRADVIPDFGKFDPWTPAGAQKSVPAPEGVDQNIWDVMTPEERKLWQK